MDLTTFADRAWTTAEAKGLHADLDGVPALGAREQALLALIPLSATLNDVIQTIKRHGVSMEVWNTVLDDLEKRLGSQLEETFEVLWHLYSGTVPSKQVRPHDKADATAIRLLLMGTELAEAMDALLSPTPDVSWHYQVCREIGDSMVRGADAIQGLGGNLDAILTEILDTNDRRPYHYGTPGARKE